MKNESRIGLRIIIVLLMMLSGCCSLVGSDISALSPGDLLNNNETVILGTLTSVDTLVSFGTISSDLSPRKVYIVEYTFRPVKHLKGNDIGEAVRLWYCVQVREKDSYDDGIRFRESVSNLVFGNRISDTNEIIKLYMPSVIGSFESLVNRLSGLEVSGGSSPILLDSIIGDRIYHSNILRNLLSQRSESGQVIYLSKVGLSTLQSYHYDIISNCNNLGLWVTTFSSKEYIVELEKESRSMKND